MSQAVWPDWAIYWTWGNFLKPLATFNLPKSPTLLCNFCKGVKNYHFSSEIIFRQLLWTFGNFFWSHWSQGTIYQCSEFSVIPSGYPGQPPPKKKKFINVKYSRTTLQDCFNGSSIPLTLSFYGFQTSIDFKYFFETILAILNRFSSSIYLHFNVN